MAKKAIMNETAAKCQALYDSGIPLFTKDAIAKCVKQMDAFLQGASLRAEITGIDGVVVRDREPLRRPSLVPTPDSNVSYI